MTNNISLIINSILFYLVLNSSKGELIKLLQFSEINLKISGTGKQQVLYISQNWNWGHVSFLNNNCNFNQLPDQILVNDIIQNYTDKFVYNLISQENNITLRWNSQLTNCCGMFNDLSNIISIDFSKFDSSKVTIMTGMFNY